MERGEYLQLRNGLYSEAEQLINEGKIEEGERRQQRGAVLAATLCFFEKFLSNLPV